MSNKIYHKASGTNPTLCGIPFEDLDANPLHKKYVTDNMDDTTCKLCLEVNNSCKTCDDCGVIIENPDHSLCDSCNTDYEKREDEKTKKKIITMYLHGDKGSNMEIAEEQLDLEGAALDKFKYALYEVKLQVEVDIKTGETKILSAEQVK